MKTSHKTLIGISLFLSVASTVFSVIAICNTNYRTLEIDYSGIVGSILSATVTVLIGWQIYSLIKLEEFRNNYNGINHRFIVLKQELDKHSLLLNAESSMLHGSNYITWVNNGADVSGLGTAYILLCHALKNYAMVFDKESAGKCITMMRDCVFYAHDKNAWDTIFVDEVNERAEADYKVLQNLHSCLNQDDSVRLIRIKESREKKFLCPELVKEKESQTSNQIINNESQSNNKMDVVNKQSSKTKSTKSKEKGKKK